MIRSPFGDPGRDGLILYMSLGDESRERRGVASCEIMQWLRSEVREHTRGEDIAQSLDSLSPQGGQSQMPASWACGRRICVKNVRLDCKWRVGDPTDSWVRDSKIMKEKKFFLALGILWSLR